MSKAAWGELQINETQLMIRNYELGVLVFPELFSSSGERVYLTPQWNSYQPSASSPTSSSAPPKVVKLPLPYDLPLTRYTPKDEIWTVDRNRLEEDWMGNVYIC
ncbi:uncharacterized protein VTP21DRAFT_11413 [Calcarisporiella thermophila]|uniref:uncharacterized protein n=1 Tax=Calcarisporiella thermophila TaxID=911321 RepID=UPI0037425E23